MQVQNKLTATETTSALRPRCSWCGHGDRSDRGRVIPFAEIATGHRMECDFGYTGLHSGCHEAEAASAVRGRTGVRPD